MKKIVYFLKYLPIRFFNWFFKVIFPLQNFHLKEANLKIHELLLWKSQAVGIEKAIDLKNMSDRVTKNGERISELFSELDNARREIKQLEKKVFENEHTTTLQNKN